MRLIFVIVKQVKEDNGLKQYLTILESIYMLQDNQDMRTAYANDNQGTLHETGLISFSLL